MQRALPALLGVTLCCLAASARAQDDAPPAPEPPAPGAQQSSAPPPASPSAAPSTPEAGAPETAPAPPEQTAPPPERRHYEGEVGVEGAEGGSAYDEEYGPDSADQPPGADHGSGFKMPGFSIRLDPFNWLLEGRLGVEIEVAVWKFISVETVPVFVANTTPPSFNFSGRDDPISQHSNGLGPISGASLGAGFWLMGTPLEGYVLRAEITNYGYTYKASDSVGVYDKVNHTERHFEVLIGSHSRFSFFTIAGDIGLGYELNQDQRCFVNRGTPSMMAATSGCPDSGELHILTDRNGSTIADLNGGLHPFYIIGRFSLGVTFD
jgi:hypothetical protein